MDRAKNNYFYLSSIDCIRFDFLKKVLFWKERIAMQKSKDSDSER
jgi:hypothetical protein